MLLDKAQNMLENGFVWGELCSPFAVSSKVTLVLDHFAEFIHKGGTNIGLLFVKATPQNN